MTEFKIKATDIIVSGQRTRVGVFVAPSPDRTFQRCGELTLDAQEASDLKQRVEQPFADLTAEEYNEVMDALMARAATAPDYALTKILTVADSVKNKFGRHAERYRTT